MQNYGGPIQLHIVFSGTANLKDEYTPIKVVIKIVIFAEFGTVLLLSANSRQCQMQYFHFSRNLVGGGVQFRILHLTDKFTK